MKKSAISISILALASTGFTPHLVTPAAAAPSANATRYYGRSYSPNSNATTRTSVNATQQYRLFCQYYAHYYNWYSKRTRNANQCRKLATMAATKQLYGGRLAAPNAASATRTAGINTSPDPLGTATQKSSGTESPMPISTTFPGVVIATGTVNAPVNGTADGTADGASNGTGYERGDLASADVSPPTVKIASPPLVAAEARTPSESALSSESSNPNFSPRISAQAEQPTLTARPVNNNAGVSAMASIAAAVESKTRGCASGKKHKWWQLGPNRNSAPSAEQPVIADNARTEPTPTQRSSQTTNSRAELQACQKPSETAVETTRPLIGNITKKTKMSEQNAEPFERAWAKQHYQEAKPLAANLVAACPDSKYYVARYYVCCVQTADWQNALSTLKTLVELDCGNKNVYECDHGRILFELGKYDDAKKHLNKYTASGFDTESAHRTLLLIAIAQKDDAAAEREYKKLLSINPADRDMQIELAELLWKQNRKDESIKIYDQVAASIPDNAEIQAKAAYANLVQGNYKTAARGYRLAAEHGKQQKFKNAMEFAEAQVTTVDKLAAARSKSRTEN